MNNFPAANLPALYNGKSNRSGDWDTDSQGSRGATPAPRGTDGQPQRQKYRARGTNSHGDCICSLEAPRSDVAITIRHQRCLRYRESCPATGHDAVERIPTLGGPLAAQLPGGQKGGLTV